MNAKVSKMVFCMGLLVLLLGRSSTNLMVAGAGGVVPDPSGSIDRVPHSSRLMAGAGGVVPDPPGSTGTAEIVS